MAQTIFSRSLFAAAAFFLAGGVAVAQSPECQRYRAELASLERSGGGGGAAAAQAQNQRAELARLSNYYRSIGCERGPFAIFSGPAPAECGPIGAQLRQMEANYARLAAQADMGAVEMRRRQLQAAVQQTCSAEPRGFFETLFGGPRTQPLPPEQLPTEDIIEQPQERALGGRRLVCVKTCDGSFFPLANAPGGRENADEMCQSLCPGAETRAFATSSGGGDALDYAVSLSGQPYTSLANAFKYRKNFDESCACKKENESWAVILRKAESMLEQKKGDILVTAEKAEELSRPKAPAAQAKKVNDKKAAAAEAAEAETAAAADAAPTASRESSGIGPQSIESTKIVGQAEGQKREVTAGGNAKKTVRVVAPDVIPVPNAQ
ncbi:DUF2865 domain-containing protein [Microvirga pudoricolor]|uniref:DUF2865 domain-containing protein n=1 Tax=Microvirga pudoricolor TaxID=2778729 RepID=UPI00194F7D8F|nr:DUF2865 domain-containing protein [Microvirga pudoricolor]MBM6594465.1 DUF2865 domain-containing protein [Microvirga pudoricolor]